MYNYTYIINNKFHLANERQTFKKSVQLVSLTLRPRTRVKYYFLFQKLLLSNLVSFRILNSFNQKYNSVIPVATRLRCPGQIRTLKISPTHADNETKTIKNQLQIIDLYLDKLYTMINGVND